MAREPQSGGGGEYLPVGESVARSLERPRRGMLGFVRGLLSVNTYLRRVKPKTVSTFLGHYAMMLENGISPVEILDSLRTHHEDPQFGRILDDVAERVFTGHTLSNAMSVHDCFPKSAVMIVKAGEEGGDVASRLRRAAQLMERSQALTSQVKSTLTGPFITVCAASVILYAIVKFVLPQFVHMYSQMEMELPLISKIVFSIVFTLNNPITVAGVLTTILMLIAFREPIKQQSFHVMRAFPWTAKMMGTILCVTACETLSFLHKDGVPLQKALELMINTSPFEGHKIKLTQARRRLVETGSLAEAMLLVEYFPYIFHTMLVVGEESGNMSALLDSCRKYMEEEVEGVLEKISAALEPIVICGLGIAMAFLFVGMFLPIYGLLDAL